MKKPRIGLMLGNINRSFSNEIAQGVCKCANDNGVEVVSLVSPPLLKKEDSYYVDNLFYSGIFEYYKYFDIDILIITYSSIYDIKDAKKKLNFLSKFKNIPYVLLQDDFVIGNNSNVVVDNNIGLSDCLEHLIADHKYKNILYFSGPKDNYDAKQRLDCYLKTMKKYKIPVKDKMIAYGDFTADIETELNKLLDNNTDIDAIMFANDTMALASYDILEKRGLAVGKDIAITGFDDMGYSKYAYPALTTISQDPSKLGYTACEEAIQLYTSGERRSIVLNSSFVVRNSCGCSEENLLENKDYNVKKIVDRIIKEAKMNPKYVFDELDVYIDVDSLVDTIKESDDPVLILDYVKNKTKNRISNNNLVGELFYDIYTSVFYEVKDINADKKEMLEYILFNYQKWFFQYYNNMISRLNENNYFSFVDSANVLKKVMKNNVALEDMFKPTLKQFKKIGVESVYIYLLKTPYHSNSVEDWKCPSCVYLTAYYDSTGEYVFNSKERIKVSCDEINTAISGYSNYAYSIGSSNIQYGYVLLKHTEDLFDRVQIICEQLNTLLYFNELKYKADKAQRELEKSYTEIEKKNEILNNISKYDELTQIYNRRGMIENAIEICKESGKRMSIMFCDLDHLKEINDVFGHKEGDFAIKKIADTLKKLLPKNAIIGRFGGDEFVAIYEYKDSDDFDRKIKDNLNRFNTISRKDYYVETSIGKVNFSTDEDVDIMNLLNDADKYLYEDKKKRRETICKKGLN